MRGARWVKFILFAVVVLPVALWAVLPTPASAIGNPNTITFGSQADTNMYMVFQNVYESGDWLFVGESYIHYVATPTDYTSEEAFSFQVINTDGVTVLYTTPVLEYENYPVSIYLTPTQASSLTWQSAYYVRLTCNPAIFGAPIEGVNMRTHALQASDYITDSPTGTSPLALRLFCIHVAEDMEANDTPPAGSEYIVAVQGVEYLTAIGGTKFLDAVPGLNLFVPNLFQLTAGVIEEPTLEPTETYASSLTVRNQLGNTIADGVQNLGVALGMSTTMAGGVLLILITLVVCGYAYVKTQSPLVPDAIAIIMPLLGAYLGLVPLALAFTAAIAIVVVSGYYFFTRGVL